MTIDLEQERARAEKGNPVAQCNLGVIFEFGDGVPVDLREAMRWYELAAAQGEPQALFNLGCMWRNGKGCRPDPEKAFSLILGSAERGYARAQVDAGCMYETGDGTKQDLARASELFRAAAQQGDPKGLFNAGAMLLNGKGVAQDRCAARFYFVEAAFRGHHGAQELLPQLPPPDDAKRSPESLARELIDIGRRVAHDGVASGFLRAGGTVRHPRAREIGCSLYRLGDRQVDLMRAACEQVEMELGSEAATELSCCWHEVGLESWQQGEGGCWLH